MSITAFFILSSRREILLSRVFDARCGLQQALEAFQSEIALQKQDKLAIVGVGEHAVISVVYNNIYLVAFTSYTTSTVGVLHFLHKFKATCETILGNFCEELLRENVVLIQSIISEAVPLGHIQFTEASALKDIASHVGTEHTLTRSAEQEITTRVSGVVPWRRSGVTHKKNEVYIDVVERFNFHVTNSGEILQCDVVGNVSLKTSLSGMPECVLGINDIGPQNIPSRANKRSHVFLSAVFFHSCVSLAQYHSDRTICFTPPEGETTLMQYRVCQNLTLPFLIVSSLRKELSTTRQEVEFNLRAAFDRSLYASHVTVHVPCPTNTSSVTVHVSSGKAKYDPSKCGIRWQLSKVRGGSEARFAAEITQLLKTSDHHGTESSHLPISIEFEIPLLSPSGFQVRFLKVHEPQMKYDATKMVRYIARAGQCEYGL